MADMTTTNHPDRNGLLAGDFPRRFMTITIASGQALAAGAVLGEVSASSEYRLAASAADDGSETPSVVLWDDVDTSEGAVEAEALIAGDVRASKLSLGEGITVAAAREALRTVSVFVR